MFDFDYISEEISAMLCSSNFDIRRVCIRYLIVLINISLHYNTPLIISSEAILIIVEMIDYSESKNILNLILEIMPENNELKEEYMVNIEYVLQNLSKSEIDNLIKKVPKIESYINEILQI